MNLSLIEQLYFVCTYKMLRYQSPSLLAECRAILETVFIRPLRCLHLYPLCFYSHSVERNPSVCLALILGIMTSVLPIAELGGSISVKLFTSKRTKTEERPHLT